MFSLCVQINGIVCFSSRYTGNIRAMSVVATVVDFCFGILGFGQVMSAAKVDLQCCLI